MIISFHGVDSKIGGNGARTFQCTSCGGLITQSDRLLPMGGTNRHLFVNLLGIECDFHTFSYCPGAIAVGEATDEQSWFSGYAWRMAFCRHCGQHLGWYYEGVWKSKQPIEFWGILVSRLMSG